MILERDIHHAVALPGQRIIDHHPVPRNLYRLGQCFEIFLQGLRNVLFRRADARAFFFPRGFELTIASVSPGLFPGVAVESGTTHFGDVQPPGMFSIAEVLGVRPGDKFSRRGDLRSPDLQEGVERFERIGLGTEITGDMGALRVGKDSVDPGVGHIASHNGNFRFFGPDGIGEVAQSSHADTDTGREFLSGLLQKFFDGIGFGRPGIVPRVHHRQPGFILPIRWRLESRTVIPIVIHRQYP